MTTPLRTRLATPLAALAATLITLPAAAQTLVPAQSEIGFVSKQMGVLVEGRFRRWTAQISFDPKKPEAGRVSFAIDTGSASFGMSETDAEVPKPAWLNVAKFPQANFQSSGIRAVGADRFEATGQLTLKGSTQTVTVPFALAHAGAGSDVATGSFTIKRLDFRVGEGEWADTTIVANDVLVKFKLTVTGVPQ